MARVPAVALLVFIAVACGGSTALVSTVIPPTHTTAPVSDTEPTSTPASTAPLAQVPTVGPTSTVAVPTIASTAEAQPTVGTVGPTVAVGISLFLSTSLTKRVEDALELVSRGEWLKVYKFQSPAFRESCPNGAFAAEATFGLSYLRNLLGIPLTDPLEFRLVSVLVDGTTGYVETQIYHDGEPVVFGGEDEPQEWVRIDGEWWIDSQIGPSGCSN